MDGVDEIYGFHNLPSGSFGELWCKEGPVMSESTENLFMSFLPIVYVLGSALHEWNVSDQLIEESGFESVVKLSRTCDNVL